MNTENLTPWDSAELLTDDEVIIEYLKAAIEENDPALFVKAIDNVAWAKEMTTIALETQPGAPQPVQGPVRRARPEDRHRDEGADRTRRSAHNRTKTRVTVVVVSDLRRRQSGCNLNP